MEWQKAKDYRYESKKREKKNYWLTAVCVCVCCVGLYTTGQMYNIRVQL